MDVPAQRNKGESVESAARRLRYRALLTVANEMGAVLLTGHTRDDQAETVLLHLERRLGRARGGIRASRPDGVVRPLLPFSRAELRTWLEAEGVPWREDETNENERFARNRVRRSVLPELERRMPGATERLARAGEAYSARLDALDRRLEEKMGEEKISLKGNWARSFFERLTDEEAARFLVRAAGAAAAGGAAGGRRRPPPPPPSPSRPQADREGAPPPPARSRVPRGVCGPEAHRHPPLRPTFTFQEENQRIVLIRRKPDARRSESGPAGPP